MKIIELILDDDEAIGVEAISVVENPAIESDFIALNKQEIKLAEIDKEKRLLMGALLIPKKPIYRKSGEDEYYIFFSEKTVAKASQMYLQNGNQSNSTLEHDAQLKDLTLVESWIVEDKQKDKTALYGLDVPVGTWMGSVKVENDEIWNDYVKTGKVKGFSIEGYFADKMERPNEELKEHLMQYPHTMYNPKTGASVQIMTKAEHDKYTKKGWTHSKPKQYEEELASYTDYLTRSK